MALCSPFSSFPSSSTGSIDPLKRGNIRRPCPLNHPLRCSMLIVQTLGRRCHSSVLWMPVAVSLTRQVERTGVSHGLLPGCGARSRPSENRSKRGILDSNATGEAGRIEREKTLVGSNSTSPLLMSCPKRCCLLIGPEGGLSVTAAASAAQVQERSA